MMKIIYNIKKLVVTKVINSVLFWDQTDGEPARTVVRILWVHETRKEEQVTTEGSGWSPGRPEVACPADEHNSTGAAGTPTVSISNSKRIKEYSTSSFPPISVKIPTFRETTTNIELATICCISTCRCKSCKRCSFWLNKPRWGRGVDCFCCCCICYARIACEIFVPELVAMAVTPVIISYIIERKRCLYSLSCRGITINSLPRILVIIIGLMFFVFDY